MILYITIFGLIAFYAVCAIMYRQTTYYKQTQKLFYNAIFNVGNYGEYLTYKRLRSYEKEGAKFLFNTYLPKDDGTTTEVDVMMLHKTGIYVFESKNYSGWILGTENQKTWTQSLPGKRGKAHKEHFLNPIWQNKLHIKWLQDQLGEMYSIHSVIVFSDRCELKNIKMTSNEATVIKRNIIKKTIQKMISNYAETITQDQINAIFEKLYPMTQVSEDVKKKHIQTILEEQGKLQTQESASSEPNSPRVESDPLNAEEKEMSVADMEGTDKIANTSETTLICPKCNGKLVKREGKGQYAGMPFWGCSNFPKCRYIQKIDN